MVNACVPCHQKKVRCDSAIAGLPCGRCLSKDRAHLCIAVTRKRRTVKRHSSISQHACTDRESLSQYSTGLEQVLTISDPLRRDDSQLPESATTNTPASEQNPSSQPNCLDRAVWGAASHTSLELMNKDTPVEPSERSHHVQTLRRMGVTDTRTEIIESTKSVASSGEAHVFEYFDRLSSISVLRESLGQLQHKRLVQIDLPGQSNLPNHDTVLAGLAAEDVAYLDSQSVFQLPPTHLCTTFFGLFFEHIYPYTPILDRIQFCKDFADGKSSHFLVNAIFANAVAYARSETIVAAGYADRDTAQRDFVRKAQLLYDFGCEKRQLTILQGSIVLSSFHFSNTPKQDHRFWIYNAVRIAMQMGLHRQNLGEDLHPDTHKLCRRIWWFLYVRDVLISVSGFSNARCMDDRETDVSPLTEEDWVEEPKDSTDLARAVLSPITIVHKQYFVANCQLAVIIAQFVRYLRCKKDFHGELSEVVSYANSLSEWRQKLPQHLRPELLLSNADPNPNLWPLILLATSYNLECIFYRGARQQLRLVGDQNAVRWCTQRLSGATFELDTLVNRVSVQNLIRHAPQYLIVCITTLIACHIEVALDQTNDAANQVTAKARIHVCLAYLRSMSDSWPLARWCLGVAQWVVHRAGLALTEITTIKSPLVSNDSNERSATIERLDDDIFQLNANAFDQLDFNVVDFLPEEWIQDFVAEGFFNQIDDAFLRTH